MQRWWNSGDAARDALGRVDDSDLVMGVGTALLGYHGLAKEALEPLASSTLVDPELIQAYLEDIDIEPVAEAISKAVASDLPEPVAQRYGLLLAQDVHRRALQATPRLASSLVAKGASWPTAVRRSANVVGVPLERLGAYPGAVTKAGLNDLGADDVADRVLMTWASAVSGSVPRSEVSKAERERVRGREKEQEAWDEASVNRDEQGRFAEEESHQARMARQARKRRKKRRQARQAAARNAATKDKDKTASQRERPADQREKAVERAAVAAGRQEITRSQAEAMVSRAEAQRAQQQMELAEAREEPTAKTGVVSAFGLPRLSQHWANWSTNAPATSMIPVHTDDGIDPNTATNVYTDKDVLTLLGGPEAFHGKEEFTWSTQGIRNQMGMQNASFDEVWQMRQTLPEVTLETYDPAVHERHVSLSADDLMTLQRFVHHPAGSLPMRRSDDAREDTTDVELQSATLAELPEGSTWTTDEEYELTIAEGLSDWKDQDGRTHRVYFQIPGYKQHHTANGVRKAERERERTNAPDRKFEESEVNRDALGRFASESSDAEKERSAARLARKKRRTKRRARQAAFAAAREQVAEQDKTKPADRRERATDRRARVAERRTGRPAMRDLVRAKERPADRRERLREVTADEMPIGLTMHSRDSAPSAGPYTLDEPLYAFYVVDGDTPTLMMTEEQLTKTLREKTTGGARRKIGRNSRGMRTEGWGPHPEHQHLPEVFRYEPGTIPLGGKSPQGTFTSATYGQINQNWESTPFTGEGPNAMEFNVAAPGDKYERRPQRVEVPVTQIVTHFSKADVSKRERERSNEPERRFKESEVNRDALGRFAEEATDEQTAARTRRLKRKARRAKRYARQQAWEQRERERTGQERATGAADQREKAADRRERGAERKAKAARSTEALRPRAGREMSAAARAEAPRKDLNMLLWSNALLAPHRTEMGAFLGQAGYMPYKTEMNWNGLALAAPGVADMLYDGVSVSLDELYSEIRESGHESGVFRNVMRPVMSGIAPHNQNDIFATTVQVLSESFDDWQPVVTEKNRQTLGPADEAVRSNRAGLLHSLTSDGQVVTDEPNAWEPRHPKMTTVVSSNTATVLKQIDALLAKANGTLGVDTARNDLAANGYRRMNLGRGLLADEAIPFEQASAEELRDTAVALMREMKVAIHPITEDALVETADLAMNKQQASDIRLDNRGVFLITSRLDKKNGWDRWAEVQKQKES